MTAGAVDVSALGDWVERETRVLAEAYANFVIHAIAERAKVRVLSVAYALPGFCHTHLPSTTIVEGCIYCAQHGNCFDRNAAKTQDRSNAAG